MSASGVGRVKGSDGGFTMALGFHGICLVGFTVFLSLWG